MRVCKNNVSEMAGKQMYFLAKLDAEVLSPTQSPFS